MITHHLITRRADRDGVDAGVVERDYVLAHVAAQLSHARMPGSGRLVFKGGTALRFVYVGDYRYSADLDFTVLNGSAEDATAALSRAVAAARNHAGFPILEIRVAKAGPPSLEYVGPLGASRPRGLKIDLAVEEHVESVARGTITSGLWDDLPDAVAFDVYPLDEIAAEKLRCVIQRVQCRDLYDLHQLTHDLGVDLSEIRTLFESKTRVKSLDPATFPDRFADRVARYGERWNEEMGEYLADPPRFDDVIRVVRRHLRAADLI